MSNKKQQLKIAVVQQCSVDDVDLNVSQVEALLQQLPPAVDVVFLPENSLYMKIGPQQSFPGIALEDPAYQPFKAWARANSAHILFGGNPTRTSRGVENATIWIRPDGSIEKVYAKIHLFDVDVAGHKPVRESDQFVAGASPAVIEIYGWKLGLAICYDVRFAELFLAYAQLGVDVITIPAAFLVPTGRAHWQVLLRARAIESQCYVVAPAQAGTHVSPINGESRASYGHSMVVDPWGQALVEIEDSQTQVQVVTLEQGRIEQVRAQIPMASHRKL